MSAPHMHADAGIVRRITCQRERQPVEAWCTVCHWKATDDDGKKPLAKVRALRHTEKTRHETRYEIWSVSQRGYRVVLESVDEVRE